MENLLSGMLMSGNSFNTGYCGTGSTGLVNNLGGAGCGMTLNNNIGTVPGSIPAQMNTFSNMQMNGSVGMPSVNQMSGLGANPSFTGNINGLATAGLSGGINGLQNMMNTVPLQFSPNLTTMSGMTYNFGTTTTNGLNGIGGLVAHTTLNASGTGLSRSPSSTGSDGEHGHGTSPGGGNAKILNGTPPR